MANLYEIFKESLGTLTLNKMRTGLAILGIVIGIGSVIALVSLGQATQVSIQNQIQSLGANLLTVRPGAASTGAVRGAFGGGTTLTNADAEAIESSSQVTAVQAVSPEVQTNQQLIAGSNNTNIQIIGATESYDDVHNLQMQTGNFISETDDNGMTKVIVLGPDAVIDLFGEGVDPVGQSVRVSATSFRVIGVTVAKGGSGFQNPDNAGYIPLKTAQKQVTGQSYLNSIAVQAKNSEVMTQAQNEIGYLLLSRHKLVDPAEADFSIQSQQDILNTVSSTTGTFTTLLAGVAAISLLVGGIGIMNIMLVTVTERTREIGLRKALGAKKKTIITQFLIESIILTFVGGIIGVIIGIITSYVISLITSSVFVVSPGSVLLAFVVSAAIGVLFGWYPASRAANLQPIEALRYE